VAELADAQASGACAPRGVEVRVLSSALIAYVSYLDLRLPANFLNESKLKKNSIYTLRYEKNMMDKSYTYAV
jgi:hypothetical protein